MPLSHEISRSDANDEIRNFIEIREEANDAGVFENLSQKAKYYFESNTLSFVFYKNQLDYLFSTVNANAYRVYFAAKDSGAPTVVIVPCELSPDESSVENRLPSDSASGNQYPDEEGTGFNKSSFDIALE